MSLLELLELHYRIQQAGKSERLLCYQKFERLGWADVWRPKNPSRRGDCWCMLDFSEIAVATSRLNHTHSRRTLSAAELNDSIAFTKPAMPLARRLRRRIHAHVLNAHFIPMDEFCRTLQRWVGAGDWCCSNFSVISC